MICLWNTADEGMCHLEKLILEVVITLNKSRTVQKFFLIVTFYAMGIISEKSVNEFDPFDPRKFHVQCYHTVQHIFSILYKSFVGFVHFLSSCF